MIESGGTSTMLLVGAMIGLVVLAIVVFVSTLAYLRSQDKKQKGSAKKRSQRQVDAAQAKPEVAPASAPGPAPAPSTQQGEVMRVLRDPDHGRVAIEVGGRRYEHIREIEDAQVGRRVLWAIADLVRFTGGMATNPRAVRNASRGMDWDEGTQRAAPRQPVGRPSLPVSPGTEPPTATAANLGQTMRAFFQRGRNPALSSDAPAEPGFVEQIDAILQTHLEALDVPLPYELVVSEGPERRLQIHVGNETYNSVDEIPNLQARALIQAAVEEWEQR
jgi:hypothetical protein